MSAPARLAIVALFLVIRVAISADAADPPLPNHKQPVDYLAWLNGQFEKKSAADAAELYTKAAEAELLADEVADVAKSHPLTWTESDRTRLADWLKKHDAALASFVQAARSNQVYLPWKSPSGKLVDCEQPYLGKLRSLAFALRARACLHLRAGNLDAALDDLAAILRAGRHLQSQPMIIDHLVGIAMAQPAYEALRALPKLVSGDIDYDKVLKRLGAADGSQPSFKNGLLGEQAFVFDALQHWGIDADGDGRIEAFEAPFDLTDATKVGSTRVELSPPVDLAAAARTIRESLTLAATLETLRYPDACKTAAEIKANNETLGRLAAFTSDAERADQIRRAREASQNATRAVLRIHAVRKATGKWPESLRDAMKGEQAPLRWDSFSAGELVYRVVDDGFVLYSIGMNQKDDGGTPGDKPLAEAGDIVYWPIAGAAGK